MRSFVTAAALTLALLLAGCAEERPAINRVQPYALAKSFFVGPDLRGVLDDPEFYRRGTLVDVGYGAGQDGLFTSSYAQPVSRVRWEITETALNARLAYERVAGTDGKGERTDGVALKAGNDGQIVASYPVTSHFDVRREYNPQTGEELNVIVENSEDRPWYEREYFRVDWSENRVTDSYDYDTLSFLGVLGGVKYDPIAYTVLEPNHPDAPHFDGDSGYFDVTNKAYASPKMIDLATLGFGDGEIPACLLSNQVAGGTDPWGNCNPIEITVRDSYRRVVDTDYEPLDFDGRRFQVLGAFNFNFRRGFARNYGMVDREWNRFISRYNIWERSHFYTDSRAMTGEIACAIFETTEQPTGDPNADPNRDVAPKDGTADECQAAGAGSRCDVYKQKCTLPYAERKALTIPWYIAGDTSLFEPTEWAVEEWDLAMKTAVQTARLVECRQTSGADCVARFPMWTGQQDDNDEAVRIAREVNACRRTNGFESPECEDLGRAMARAVAAERGVPQDSGTLAIGELVAMQPLLVLCHNPVIPEDHAACGKPGLSPKLGDIRYNIVENIENPQMPSAWGIMTDGDDPLTGEKVAGTMNIWTHVTDQAAQQLVDLVRYANGELATLDITSGDYVRDWAGAARLGARGGLPTLSQTDVDQRLASLAHIDAQAFSKLTAADTAPQIQALVQAGKARALDVHVRSDVPSPGFAKVQAALSRARGTAVEAELLNPAMMALAGAPSGVTSSGAIPAQVSPLALNNPLARARLREMRENGLAARGACILDAAPEPSSLTGMADALNKKFPAAAGESKAEAAERYRRMFRYVQRHYHYAVMAHEMGHSVGLRHNFVSSSASLFYRPQYWQLRTKNGAVTSPCTDAVDDGAGCVGPRYFDPVTDEEQSQLIWMWMQSTSMDYPGDVSQNFLGLGVTDFAAARFFYGDTVSVYTNPSYRAGTAIGTGLTLATDDFGGLFGIRYGMKGSAGQGSSDFHYSQLQRNYKVIDDCRPTQAAPPASYDASVDGVWDPVLDGHVVAIDGQASKCRQQPVDYVGYGELAAPTDAQTNSGAYRGSASVHTATSRIRVPYGFASDHWADLGNVSVLRHDNGADPYEQAQFLITTQETRHIFDNYRRGRSTFSLREAASRSFERYNRKLEQIAGGLGFLSTIYRDLSANQGYSFESLWPVVVRQFASDNMLAATLAFDHFTRGLSRPEPGAHYRRAPVFQDPVFHSATDPDDFGPDAASARLIIPNGATGYLRDVGFGGHPLENALSSSHGDFDVEYVENAGSYYDKIHTAILLADSEDRFVSQSRRDFYDARFRAVGIADVVPDGFRRLLGNALTGDRSLLAPRVEADQNGEPLLEAAPAEGQASGSYPARPLGWVSLWPTSGPEVCFANQGRNVCSDYAQGRSFSDFSPANTALVDPQIGWEVQKFLIVWTVALIKANEKTDWLDMLRLYRLGKDAEPELERRIEWQDPSSGEIYYARSYGSECFFGNPANACQGGKMVEKGIAARILEYAGELTQKGYQLDEARYPATARYPAGFNAFGRPMVSRHPDGTAIVRADPAVKDIGGIGLRPILDCDQNVDLACKAVTIDQNRAARELYAYKSVPDYLWQTGALYGLFADPSPRGIF